MEVDSSAVLLIILLQVPKRPLHKEVSTNMFKNRLILVELSFSNHLQPQLMRHRDEISNDGTVEF